MLVAETCLSHKLITVQLFLQLIRDGVDNLMRKDPGMYAYFKLCIVVMDCIQLCISPALLFVNRASRVHKFQ